MDPETDGGGRRALRGAWQAAGGEGGLAEHAGGGCGGREGPRQRDRRLSPGGSIHGGEVMKRGEEESYERGVRASSPYVRPRLRRVYHGAQLRDGAVGVGS
ncbi:hypothetical protein Pmani_036042 [Petrolisthes manimaculis]|uniref:Uncharacterized protein n=1 Tax=Petrolisthes manimaculis TaxID=1843537 RepID=A0AAE1NL62_9EUCA|nr:hypothetical protein Pmani_036042 [Petrolisthes manimaculis]